MVGAFADAVATALGGGTQAFEHGSAIYEDGAHIQFAVFGLALVLGFPVGDSRTEELLYTGCLLYTSDAADE